VHEASVTEALVKLALEEALSRDALRVTAIGLVVGETTGYMGESLEFYFRNFSKGTILEGASLNIAYVKPKIKCPNCSLVFERKKFTFECPACGTPGEMTGIGNEFYIDTMDIETGER
jgi:hydrogenase nickel incorporation protein HypA/HybF